MKRIAVVVAISLLALLPASAKEEAQRESLLWPIVKDSFFPVLVNMVPGFGFGSFFVQRDTAGGLVQLISESIGVAMFGYVYFGALGYYPSTRWPEDLDQYWAVCTVFFGASYVWGLIRPIWFATETHVKARQSTSSLDHFPTITIAPVPTRSRIAVEWAIRFALE
jgi:hypothetical protein